MNMNDAFVGSLIFNKNGGGGGASAMSDLTDVNITSPSEGETLVYDSTSEQWVNGQGGGKQQEVTQAQYDALVSAGTVDPTVEYFISDGIPSSVEYSHNYSTTEHIVGTWIDGKTLYERTLYWDNTTHTFVTGANALAHDIQNMDYRQLVSGTFSYVYTTSGTTRFYYPLPYSNDTPTGGAANLVKSLGNNAIGIFVGNDYNSYKTTIKVWITIQYTKSTI